MRDIPPLRTSLNANKSQRRNFHKLYRDTKLPFRPNIGFANKDEIDEYLAELDLALASRRYMPSAPRGMLVEERSKGIPRFIPLLELRDSCVYHHCVSTLERDSQFVRRVANTFAGWKQSNSLRRMEEEEFSRLESVHALPMLWTPYPEPQLALHRFRKVWRDFAHAAYLHSRAKQDGVAVHLDISSFFYSISLPLLQQKIRHAVDPILAPTMDLLFAFLEYADRGRLGYFPNTHGIPVEELGDSSRVLAQIFLHDYDEQMLEYCDSAGERYGYIRFADDQVLFAPDLDSAKHMLFKASELLHHLGLQVNTAKVQVFQTMADFDYYWSFDVIESSQFRQELDFNWIIQAYLERFASSDPREWRDDRLRHLIIEHASPDSLNYELLERYLEHCLEPSRLVRLDSRRLLKLFRLAGSVHHPRLLRMLSSCSDSSIFNGFHLNLIKFSESQEAKSTGFVPPKSALIAKELAYRR